MTVNRGNVKRTALALGIPRQTLNRWARGQYVGPDALRCKQKVQEQLAPRFEQVALDCLDAITPKKYHDSSLRDLAWAAAVSVDKMRLLREESTVIADKRNQIEILITEVAAKYRKPVDEVRKMLIRIRPEVAAYIETVDSRDKGRP